MLNTRLKLSKKEIYIKKEKCNVKLKQPVGVSKSLLR